VANHQWQNPTHNNSYKQYSDPNNVSSSNNNSSRQPLSQQQNGISKSSTRSEFSDPSPKLESDYLAPSRVNMLRNKASDISNHTSEPDSLIDLYKQPSNSELRNGSHSTSTRPAATRKGSGPNGSRKGSTNPNDEDYWIHRDKLKEIESRELEEAGFRLDRRSSERMDASYKRDKKRQRVASPDRIEDDEFEDAAAYDYRSPDDASTTPPKSFIPKPQGQRPGGSRIPIPRGVAVQSPAPTTEKGSPGTRSRNGSNAWNNGSDGSPQSQPGQSSGQDTADDDMAYANPQTPPLRATSLASSSEKQASPAKSRGPTKAAPTARKTTPRNSTSTKARTASGKQAPATTTTTELKRPGTSSGNPRPSTSHRPEGDPPWIASMYKPDPRLPPDQQMLPTHAKRLAQEQWEKEGKTGTVYDREFRLLNSESFPLAPPLQQSPTKSSYENSVPPSPAKHSAVRDLTVDAPRYGLSFTPPLGSPRSQVSGGRPGTSGTTGEHGGYRTMPTITKPPTPTVVSTPSATVQPIRVMDGPEDEPEKKKGCLACCVVM
jgi:hypothetical protein